MADTTKKTTRTKKPAASKSSVPTAKAAAAEAKPAATPAAVKTAVKPVAAAPAPVAKPVAPAPAPAAKPVAAPAPVAAKVEQKSISKSERQRLVEQAAYFRAEKHGFQGDSSQHWAAAEAEVDADLRKRNVRVV